MAKKDAEVRGEGLGDESGLSKVEGGALEESQKARDEINERGFVSADDEQAEILLEEDRAGSLPEPREPKHEQERKDELLKRDAELRERAAEQD